MLSLRVKRDLSRATQSMWSYSPARFASTSPPSRPSKPIRGPAPLGYKGRVVKPSAPVEEAATVESAPVAEYIPPKPKREQTKEQKYRTAARRYIGVMVGAPIAIVTSYYLYRRLFLGEEKKNLVLINEATE